MKNPSNRLLWNHEISMPSKTRLKETYLPISILISMMLIYSIVLIRMTTIKHNGFGTSGFDIGILDQGTWLLSQGKYAFVTVNGLHIFGGHVRPIQLLIAPLYWIWDDIRILLVIQTLVLAIGAVPIYLIAKDKIGDKWVSLIFPFSYLLYPPLEYMNLWQYHPEALATTFILFAFYFVTKQKYSASYLFSFLALLTKEDVGLVVLFLGGYIYFKHDRRAGIITSVMAVFWLIFAFKIVLPYYNDVGSMHLNSRFSHLGSGPLDVIKNAIFNPKLFIDYVWTPAKRLYIFQLLAPVGFLAVLSPLTLLIATPTVASNLLSNHSYMHSIRYNYIALIVPFIYISTIYASAKLMRNRKTKVLISLLLILSAGLTNYYFMSPSPFSKRSLDKYFGYQYPSRVAFTNEAISLIPPDASVSATPFFVPHLTHREKIYEFPNPFKLSYWGINGENPPPKDVEYVLADTNRFNKEEKMIFDLLLDETLYAKIFEKGGVAVLKKVFEGDLDRKYEKVKIQMDPKIKDLAVERKNYPTCDKVVTPRIREECFKEVGIVTGDYNLCHVKIVSRDLRDECFNEIALNKKEYAVCDRIGSVEMKEECFKEVGIATGDYNLCHVKIKSQARRDECFSEISIATGDLNICLANVESEALKAQCKEKISRFSSAAR